MNATQSPAMIHLDGRTLEGGGQLVRIAVALSALTGKSVSVTNIRGNREGKKGLKRSHLAAVQLLAELTGSSVSGAEVGSSSLSFYPARPLLTPTSLGWQKNDGSRVQHEINIKLPTAGSVFLVFQAVYPYLLCTSEERIRLTITGGTNVSYSPSFDYISQVLMPNLAKLGFPPLAVHLEKRGWGTGPISLGKVAFVIDPLEAQKKYTQFPRLDLGRYRRGQIIRIDITVLAPDDPLEGGVSRTTKGRKGKGRHSGRTTYPGNPEAEKHDRSPDHLQTVRGFVEREACRQLHARLGRLPAWVCLRQSGRSGEAADCVVPISIHGSEPTRHPSQIYLLLVAHTSTGFKIGHDGLSGPVKTGGRQTERRDRENKSAAVTSLVNTCVDGFIRELYDPELQPDPVSALRQPCVDETMRDQLVVFEALGGRAADGPGEDERYWSLHTLTAQWVCREMLEG